MTADYTVDRGLTSRREDLPVSKFNQIVFRLSADAGKNGKIFNANADAKAETA